MHRNHPRTLQMLVPRSSILLLFVANSTIYVWNLIFIKILLNSCICSFKSKLILRLLSSNLEIVYCVYIELKFWQIHGIICLIQYSTILTMMQLCFGSWKLHYNESPAYQVVVKILFSCLNWLTFKMILVHASTASKYYISISRLPVQFFLRV